RGDVQRLDRPPAQIPASVDRLVLWETGPIPEEDWQSLMDWVATGHTLLVGGESAAGPLITQDGSTSAHPSAAHPALAGVSAVQTNGASFNLRQPALILLTNGRGRPVLVSEQHGEGQIIWSADYLWLTDKFIAQSNNLELALGLLRPAPGRTVAFDEYHHGYSAIEHWWQILRGPLQLFVLQLGAALLLFFWAAGRRFGRPRPEPRLPARAAVEYVGAMSNLYRRSRAKELVRRALYGALMRSLGGLLGGVRGLSHAQIAERTSARTPLASDLIERTLNGLASAPAATTLSESDLLTLARQAAAIQRSVRHAGFRDQQRTAKD
ncbi:MAG TPA: DUF4350 domain-containing protein, partial [Symbiobacteriaceae bacterium]|nr:DUF4350 domain-containing protein [Symbiobacteriaceae bacterium]